jgi:hypothetical protein
MSRTGSNDPPRGPRPEPPPCPPPAPNPFDYFFNRPLLIRIIGQLDRIEATLATQAKTLEKIMSEQDDLKAAMGNITDAVGVAITEIQTLASEIAANSGDPAAIEAAAGNLNTLATNLKAAVAAATPPPPTP